MCEAYHKQIGQLRMAFVLRSAFGNHATANMKYFVASLRRYDLFLKRIRDRHHQRTVWVDTTCMSN